MTQLEDEAARQVKELFDGMHSAFQEDSNLAVALVEIIDDCSYIVETGTWAGNTTRWFRKMFPYKPYVGLEMDSDRAHNTRHNVPGAEIITTASAVWLAEHLGDLGDRPFLYLDAHGYVDEPTKLVLQYELDVLVKLSDMVILIHDYDDGSGAAFNPGYTEDKILPFLKLRPDLGLYHCNLPLRIGAALIMQPPTSRHWRYVK